MQERPNISSRVTPPDTAQRAKPARPAARWQLQCARPTENLPTASPAPDPRYNRPARSRGFTVPQQELRHRRAGAKQSGRGQRRGDTWVQQWLGVVASRLGRGREADWSHRRRRYRSGSFGTFRPPLHWTFIRRHCNPHPPAAAPLSLARAPHSTHARICPYPLIRALLPRTSTAALHRSSTIRELGKNRERLAIICVHATTARHS